MIDGNKVRSLRENEGLTLEELAQVAGLSLNFMSYIERNLRDTNTTALARIASKLGVSADELLREESF